ncbi:MAG TPA: hypothetical protein VFN09_09650 [Rhodanobacteraceae bacterium]|nr:hypothetical protein [Rhodanobacteraceae bacterium]
MHPPTPRHDGHAWYRQPILWLSVVIFIASMAGCIWMIAVSLRYDETPTHHSQSLLGVPTSSRSTSAGP